MTSTYFSMILEWYFLLFITETDTQKHTNGFHLSQLQGVREKLLGTQIWNISGLVVSHCTKTSRCHPNIQTHKTQRITVNFSVHSHSWQEEVSYVAACQDTRTMTKWCIMVGSCLVPFLPSSSSRVPIHHFISHSKSVLWRTTSRILYDLN